MDHADGLVDEAWWRVRQDDYLLTATRVWDPGSVLNVLDHLAWRQRWPTHGVEIDAIDANSLTRWFARIDGRLDCADFDILRLLHIWCAHRDDLPAPVRHAVETRLVGFKLWYDEPTPAGVLDECWYWSENHRLIFHTIEYLVGQLFPDVRCGTDGAPGTTHLRRARDRLAAWFDEKAHYGFSEWHSDVYYEKDLSALLTLAEWAEDRALAGRAAAFLDLLLFDIALHLHRGNLGTTHGRSYAKDKTQAPDQIVFSAAKLVFDATTLSWPLDRGNDRTEPTPLHEGASLLARARRYRPPEVVCRVARRKGDVVDREGMGVHIDPSEPLSDAPERADRLSYTDPDLVPFWWDRSALTAWQLVPLTLATMDRHALWDISLFAPFAAIRDVTGGDVEVARRLAHSLAPIVNAGLLARVNTYTYRSPYVMLSTAQSYRPGCAGFQQHVWQATLDERAVVFTTHPGNEPWPDPTTWHDLDHYWTGSATLPRSLQHRTVAVHQYAPAYPPPNIAALAPFQYLPYTHAFFPTERFDTVTCDGHWTLGCRGDAYVALWSWRPVRWRLHDPKEVHTNGLAEPFDLVAEGGATNVWIVEVGDVSRWGGFPAFREAVLAASIEVVDLGLVEDGSHRGFGVSYASPSEGVVECGWDGPIVVAGQPVPIDGYPRFDNPFTFVRHGQMDIAIRDGEYTWALDLAAGTRAAQSIR